MNELTVLMLFLASVHVTVTTEAAKGFCLCRAVNKSVFVRHFSSVLKSIYEFINFLNSRDYNWVLGVFQVRFCSL